jgi:hypothetical protein
MTRLELATITSLLLLAAAKGATALAVPPAAELDAPRLREALLRAQQRIESFRVVYESDDYDDDTTPAGYMLHRVVVCQAPNLLFHWTAHGHDKLAWEDDHGQQIARIRDGNVLNEYPVNRSYYEAQLDLKGDGLPGTLPHEFLFSTVGFWPFTTIKPPQLDGEPFVLVDVARSEQYDSVLPHLQQVEGRWCHVLERKGKDRLWLDVNRGCALMARETCAPTTGRLGQRIELGGHREVASGIWFPKWIRNIQYDHGASDSRRQMRVWKNARHDILEVTINEVDDSVFTWSPPTGALRIFDDAPSVQTRAGGLEHLDHLTAWIMRNCEVKRERSSPATAQAAMIVVLASVASIELWRLLHHSTRAAAKEP